MSSLATNSLRSSLRRVASCSRYSSSQASSSLPPSSSSSAQKLDIRPKAELTEDKMRALVDLYHQSARFITKANLDSSIDDAFIHRRSPLLGPRLISEASIGRLETDLYLRRNRPKFGQLVRPTERKSQMDEQWSEQRSPREAAVFTTLYGVFNRGRPAYDALMDQQRSPKVEEEVVKEDASVEWQPTENQQSSA
uniref:Acetylornithine/succinyldiaminopimelate aminotransferase (ACOAT) (DapATase) (Succinyldiaminopimelate transferase) ) n=1 Tax=Ganoderma boninense TaxID=34458 RepID=A0A5K1JXY5_9APHY|nr:Acetylornithine/succinyldiaminopimelate aminotransferase (ACOAT) (DapATase) (Succinyldiaminopimelate transferase) (EC (EC [Ganoderma boninense]